MKILRSSKCITIVLMLTTRLAPCTFFWFIATTLFLLSTATLAQQRTLFQSPNVAFDSNRSGAPQIWQVSPKPPTTGIFAQVTNQGTTIQPIQEPSWSNTGWIVYQFGASGVRGLHVIRPHGYNLGTDEVRLIHDAFRDERDPSWSPDGRYIVYSSLNPNTHNYELWIYDTNGTPDNPNDDNKYQLLLPGAGTMNLRPAWSPDSHTVAFMTSGGSVGPRAQVAIVPVNSDGTNNGSVTLLMNMTTNNGFNSHPSWSPDSQNIVFSSTRTCQTGCGGHTLFLVNVACSEIRGCPSTQLTFALANDTNPAWSRDGQTIAFSSDRDHGNRNIWTVTFGDGTQQITFGGNTEDDPTWQPDHNIRQLRPIMLGSSGGNINDHYVDPQRRLFCYEGTLGSLVQDTSDGTKYILSNNHVIGLLNLGEVGETIIEPGLVQVGCQENVGDGVANLSSWVTILPCGQTLSACLNSNVVNTVDAAIAAVQTNAVSDIGSILEIGNISKDIYTVSLADVDRLKVKKSGATSLVTWSTVVGINMTCVSSFHHGLHGKLLAKFVRQIVFSPDLSLDGDSGSLIVTDTEPAQAVALLMSGNGTVTIGNPIDAVLANSTFGNLCLVDSTGQCINQSEKKRVDSRLEAARRVQEVYGGFLLGLPGAFGHAIGMSHSSPREPVIRLFVRSADALDHSSVPHSIEGVEIEIVETLTNPCH